MERNMMASAACFNEATPLRSKQPNARTCINASSEDALQNPQASKKRHDYLSWDDYFMGVALLSAKRSKDPNTQVGSCIVDEDKRIVGVGYNGMPRGCSDDDLPWCRDAENPLDTKYPYVCHSEMNAILNKNSSDVKKCTIYTVMFPCNECAKIIIQAGIKNVRYLHDKPYKIEMQASRRMFEMSGVSLEQFIPSAESVTLDFTAPASLVSRNPAAQQVLFTPSK